MNLIESIRAGQGVEALNAIKSSLNQKTLAAVEEARHEIAESVYGGNDLTEDIDTNHPSFKAGHKSYETNVMKPAKTLKGQSQKNNHSKLEAKKAHIAKFGTLPEKLKAGQHFDAGYDAAHAKHAYSKGKEQGWMKESLDLQEGSGGAIPWPTQSKHLKDYKKNEAGEYVHPEGHKITVNKEKNEITHTTKDGKSKTFKHLGDLHPHLSKLHHGFDEKVKEHMANHSGGPADQNRLHHKMGALSYKFHKTGYGSPAARHANHEEDATNYKAMHKALMNLSKHDRGVR
jgi:hypothetical protein